MNSSLWKIKDIDALINLSLSQANFNLEKLQLMIANNQDGDYTNYSYMNSSGSWVQVRIIYGAGFNSRIFEEAIWWNISNFPTNPYLEIGTPDSTYEWNVSGTYKVNAEKCYQETANVSTACGGLDTGVYFTTGDWSANVGNLYDGDFGTSDAVGDITGNS